MSGVLELSRVVTFVTVSSSLVLLSIGVCELLLHALFYFSFPLNYTKCFSLWRELQPSAIPLVKLDQTCIFRYLMQWCGIWEETLYHVLSDVQSTFLCTLVFWSDSITLHYSNPCKKLYIFSLLVNKIITLILCCVTKHWPSWQSASFPFNNWNTQLQNTTGRIEVIDAADLL